MTNINIRYPNSILDWEMEDLYKAEDLIKAGHSETNINKLANKIYKKRIGNKNEQSGCNK
jgi:hypothetical protein